MPKVANFVFLNRTPYILLYFLKEHEISDQKHIPYTGDLIVLEIFDI